MDRHANKFVLVWALALTAFLVMGLTVPNTFTSGTTISSAEMNANFAAINAAVTALEDAPGRIIGVARIRGSDGVVLSSWMANGETPTCTHVAASGLYEITWGSLVIPTNMPNRVVLANAVFTNYYCNVSADSPVVRIRCYDATGALADPFGITVAITGNLP